MSIATGRCRCPDGEAKLTEPASRVSQAALFGGTTTTIDFAPVEGGMIGAAGDRAPACSNGPGQCYGDYAFHTMLLGKLSPDIYAQIAEAVQAGHPERQDVHHRHHPVAQGPHGAARRHLGGVEGPGESRRHRGDPRRGQRHRHAHVRKADARAAHRLREHGRGAQHAVGGSGVQPGDPARLPMSRARRST